MGLEKLNPFHKKTAAAGADGLEPTKSTSSIRSFKDGVKKVFDQDTAPREPFQNRDGTPEVDSNLQPINSNTETNTMGGFSRQRIL